MEQPRWHRHAIPPPAKVAGREAAIWWTVHLGEKVAFE